MFVLVLQDRIRTARSRTSGKNVLGLAMTRPSKGSVLRKSRNRSIRPIDPIGMSGPDCLRGQGVLGEGHHGVRRAPSLRAEPSGAGERASKRDPGAAGGQCRGERAARRAPHVPPSRGRMSPRSKLRTLRGRRLRERRASGARREVPLGATGPERAASKRTPGLRFRLLHRSRTDFAARGRSPGKEAATLHRGVAAVVGRAIRLGSRPEVAPGYFIITTFLVSDCPSYVRRRR